MDAVGVVPNQGEVGRCGLQACQPGDGLLRIDEALGVGEFGNAPDALDRRVLDQLLHQVHVRALRRHGDGDHFHAEGLGDGEMTVIARGRAEPFDLGLPAPGLGAVQQAVGPGLGDQVIHELQAGGAAHEALLRLAVQNFGKEALGGRQAGEVPVVAGVDAVAFAVLRLGQGGEDAGDQVELLLAGLAASHIQLQLLPADAVKFLPQGLVQGFLLRPGQIFKGFHVFFILSQLSGSIPPRRLSLLYRIGQKIASPISEAFRRIFPSRFGASDLRGVSALRQCSRKLLL